jgi:hypothetical protein
LSNWLMTAAASSASCTTVLDSAAPPGHDGGESALSLAALSREIAANHWQARDPAARTMIGPGGPLDRNTTLLVPFPRERLHQ